MMVRLRTSKWFPVCPPRAREFSYARALRPLAPPRRFPLQLCVALSPSPRLLLPFAAAFHGASAHSRRLQRRVAPPCNRSFGPSRVWLACAVICLRGRAHQVTPPSVDRHARGTGVRPSRTLKDDPRLLHCRINDFCRLTPLQLLDENRLLPAPQASSVASIDGAAIARSKKPSDV